MRVIGGALGGRRLAPVKGRMRPTADKVRQAMFNILGDAVSQAQVLDLFAGTGALGIEALSRGAAQAVFVEENPESLKVLRRNLESLGLMERAQVLPWPALAALKKLAAQAGRFEVAFLDPPYGLGLAEKTLAALAEAGLMAPEAVIVVEHSRREQLPEAVGALTCQDLRRYGDTRVAFYRPAGMGGAP
jgi:16S rRNA (guanine(966)-N(2))-methyltransferase RsmD